MSDGGDQSQAQQRPWASPRLQPIKGIVQPRVLPPFGKPTRHTNRLDYIMTTVLKEATKHKHVWPFLKPVDAQALCIPLYHERVLRPMDLKTIESRLKSTYYTSSQECIDDIETVFQNCYSFNGKEDDVTIMAQNVHEVIKKSLEQAPREELDMDVYWGKNKKKTGKESTKAAGSSGTAKKDSRAPSEQPSEAGSESAPKQSAKPERKVAGKKTGKRKAETDDDEKPEPNRAKRDVTVTKKETNQPISPIMKPCSKLLAEFFSKKYAEFAWAFYDPVDAEGLGLYDYHKIIHEPMDMKKIKSRLENGTYKEPADFERDMRLMINNCLTYNPPGDPVHSFGTRFMEVFDKRWADMSDANSRASSVAPPPPAPPVAAPKVTKSSAPKETKKEIKTEPASSSFFETGGAKSEDIMQINNALSMLREREERLKAELAAAAVMKEKLMSVKSRREGHPNEPFPDKLITETRIMCTTQPGLGTSLATSPAAVPTRKTSGSRESGPPHRNGRVKKPNPTAKQYGYEFDSDDEENKPALTYEEKRHLSHLVNRLPPPQLSTIISIIQRRECSALTHQSVDDSEIELDFESLGDMCLREMAAFMLTLEKKDGLEEDDSKPGKPSIASIVGISSRKAKGEAGDGKSAAPSTSKGEKKKKNFNMSESSDDETSTRKRRKKDSSESESSSSSDDESDDDAPIHSGVPRKSGQPPSSRDWNQTTSQPPPPRMGGMGGQPPMARVPPSPAVSNMAKNAPGASSSYLTTTSIAPTPASTTAVTIAATTAKTPAATPSTLPPTPRVKSVTATLGTVKNNEKPPVKKSGTSILDTLLPDTFGSSSSSQKFQAIPGPSIMTSPTEYGGLHTENGENEADRIRRMRMEAKRARQREDENSLSMTNQMEMMSAFEYDNTY